ncbi:unnamed protein product, partial [Timema podura]|nr:unnamed protein product [Timema podura]
DCDKKGAGKGNRSSGGAVADCACSTKGAVFPIPKSLANHFHVRAIYCSMFAVMLQDRSSH